MLNAPDGFEWLKNWTSWRQVDHQLFIDVVNSQGHINTIEFTHEMERVWRMRFAPGDDLFPELGILVNKPRPLPVQVTEDPDQLVVSNEQERLLIQRNPLCISLQDKNGNEICRENPYDVDGLNRLFILPLGFVKERDGTIKFITESGIVVVGHIGLTPKTSGQFAGHKA